MTMPKKVQTLAEVSLLLSLVAAALVGMQAYIKRGLQARYKSAVDGAVATAVEAGGQKGMLQYEPYYRDEHSSITSKQATQESFKTVDNTRTLTTNAHSYQKASTTYKEGIEFDKDTLWQE